MLTARKGVTKRSPRRAWISSSTTPTSVLPYAFLRVRLLYIESDEVVIRRTISGSNDSFYVNNKLYTKVSFVFALDG